jgi:asparagine N-glycosylation enzyme membrane subunit Stt3
MPWPVRYSIRVQTFLAKQGLAIGEAQETRGSMKNPGSFLAVTFLWLALLALSLATHAFHRGNIALFVVLIFAAVILFNRLQGKRS